jgi:quinoprotein relay system zinc metallohydrolase 1
MNRLSKLLARCLPVALIAGSTIGQQTPAYTYQLSATPINTGVWVIAGHNEDFSRTNGCNIINTSFIQSDQGVWVINTGPSLRYGLAQRQLIENLTRQKVTHVLNLNLHPDYFFGNQAYPDALTEASPLTRQGMQREAASYADNLYRLCGDWMLGTEPVAAQHALTTDHLSIGSHQLELHHLSGHTDDDLVVIDRAAGIIWTGGLVFSHRIPTVPHAKIDQWLKSLDALQALCESVPLKALIPSHGEIRSDISALKETRDYLQWLDQSLNNWARQGLDLTEVLLQPLPARFADYAAAATEYPRNLLTLYPSYERRLLN